MNLNKNKAKSIFLSILVSLSFSVIFILHSCDCIGTDEKLDLYVFAGERTNCRELISANKASNPDLTYICPGEKVTICWSSSNISELTLDIGGQTEIVAVNGTKVITVDATKDIKLIPSSANCVSTRSKTVKVISGPTPTTFDAGWDCDSIRFAVSDAFMSTKIISKDITANWRPIVTYS